jgi:hypothetical protein
MYSDFCSSLDLMSADDSAQDMPAVSSTQPYTTTTATLANEFVPPVPLNQYPDVSPGLFQEQTGSHTSNGTRKATNHDNETRNCTTLVSVSGKSIGNRSHFTQIDLAMHLAASQGQTAIIAILLGNGAYIDSLDDNGQTPLLKCTENGHIEATELLLASGADPKILDSQGTSAILMAVKAGHEKIVDILARRLHDG